MIGGREEIWGFLERIDAPWQRLIYCVVNPSNLLTGNVDFPY